MILNLSQDTDRFSVAQAVVSGTGALGMIAGPIVGGALCKSDNTNGWRTFYVS